MAFDASPPIISKYTRQVNMEVRPRTPVTDSLDESSLAPWWNVDKAMNMPNNLTPFRKQRYEPLKWANAHLLLEEDGADFLADDPFATPAPSKRLSLSTKKQSSARKRNSNVASGYPRASRSSAGSHRDLTLADLTPRSRRLSGFRTKNIALQRSRASDGMANVKPLRLSFNGPAFAPSPRQDLEVIQEHHSPAPLLPAFRPLTPERPAERPSPERNLYVSPNKTASHTPTRPRKSESRSISVREDAKQRRKSRGSIPTARPSQKEASSDNEELHKSIPGAFDFIASKPFQPELPTKVLPEKAPRKSNVQELATNKRGSSASARPSTVAAPAASGLANMLAEYGNSLMGILGPNIPQPAAELPTKRSSAAHPTLKLSDLSPKRPVIRDAPKPAARREIPSSPAKQTKSRPSIKASVAPTSRMQRHNQPVESQAVSQLTETGEKEIPVQSTSARGTGDEITQSLDHPRVVASPACREASKPRSQSRPRPSSTFETATNDPRREKTPSALAPYCGVNSASEEVTARSRTAVAPSVTSAPAYVEPPLEYSRPRVSGIVKPTLPSPSPQRMHIDAPSPVKRVSPVKRRPSIIASRTVATHVPPAPVAAAASATAANNQSHRAPKPILKKRALELSPAKVGLEGHAVKRQKISEVKGKDRLLTVPVENMVGRGKVTAPLERNIEGDAAAREKSRGRKAKMEQAPRKQARSRSRVNDDIPVVAPLILPNTKDSSSMHRSSRSCSRGHDAVPSMRNRSRSHSRPGHPSTNVQNNMGLDNAEDVFGTVVENSLEIVAANRTLATKNLPTTVLESMSPVPRKQQIDAPQPRREEIRLENYRQPVARTLQPSLAHNSPMRKHSPVRTVLQKPAAPAPVRPDYRPPQVEDFSFNPFAQPPRHRFDRDEDDGCRLTIPILPKAYMRPQRRERDHEEPQRRAVREMPRRPVVQLRQNKPFARAKQREMPPVAAALLAKLAGVKAGLNPKPRTGGTIMRTGDHHAVHQFTFRAELRPVLGREGAVLADQALKEQFESRRNLWEQRSLEASQESRTSERSGSRSTSRHGERRIFATEARAMEREARRDVRRQREERVEWNRSSRGHGW